MFCFHKWIVNREIDMPSAFEQMYAHKVTRLDGSSKLLFQKKRLIVYKCEKCGAEKIKAFVNPE